MPSVSLLNTEWRDVCKSIQLSLKQIELKEKRIVKEVSALLAHHDLGSEKIHLYQLGNIIYWAEESYTARSKGKTASHTELCKLRDTIKKLEELKMQADVLLSKRMELEAIYRKIKLASNKRNGLFDVAATSSSGSSSSSSSGNSIDDTILTDPWGY